MIRLQTAIEDLPSDIRIGYKDRILSIGSCFAENIGQYMKACRFNIAVNPSGIAYNPYSVLKSAENGMNGTSPDPKETVENEGLYYHLMFHGDFYAAAPEELLKKINENIRCVNHFCRHLDILMVTFGTARVYKYLPTGTIVSNCHKLPQKLFSSRLLSIDEITDEWISFIERIRKSQPDLKIIFTVSPIRHWKDGAHGNQISKSTLLVAIDNIIRTARGCDYFPAYEIMMDELRDYRFYDEDMLHPSKTAVEYIRKRFLQKYLDNGSAELFKRIEKLNRAKNHRPLHPESREWTRFQENINREEHMVNEILAGYIR